MDSFFLFRIRLVGAAWVLSGIARRGFFLKNQTMKYICLLLLLSGALISRAVAPLEAGSYFGQWMGAPQGYVTGDSMRLVINTNREVELFYTERDPITGSTILKNVPARLIEQRIMRGRGNASMRGYSQWHGQSVRGWFRIQGRKVNFFAHLDSPSAAE